MGKLLYRTYYKGELVYEGPDGSYAESLLRDRDDWGKYYIEGTTEFNDKGERFLAFRAIRDERVPKEV